MLKLKVLYNSIQVHNDTGEYLKQDEFKWEANADFAIRGYLSGLNSNYWNPAEKQILLILKRKVWQKTKQEHKNKLLESSEGFSGLFRLD